MADIREFSTRMIKMRIDGGYVKEFSGFIKYKYSSDKISSFHGEILYTFDDEWIKDFHGRKLLRITNSEIKDFYGRTLGYFDSKYLKRNDRFNTHVIDGYLSRDELMVLITMIYLEEWK
jgi:hypothetical protein